MREAVREVVLPEAQKRRATIPRIDVRSATSPRPLIFLFILPLMMSSVRRNMPYS